MNISRFITLGCISLLIGGFVYQTSSYGHNVSESQLIVQSNSENNSAAIQNKAETMIKLFFAQKFDSFSDFVVPELEVSVSSERMKKAWQEIKEEKGAFSRVIESQVINTPVSDLVTVTIEFDKVTEDWIFVFNDNQKIIGINSPLSKSLEDIADEFLSAVIEGDYSKARAYFHPFLKETIFPQEIESSWNKLISNNGKFERIVDIDLRIGSDIAQTNIALVELEFSKRGKEIIIIFDSSKNIIGVDFVEQ